MIPQWFRAAATIGAIAGLSASAEAQANYGDLVLGFVPDASVSSGQTLNLMVDLGNAGGFINDAVGTYAVADLGAALASTYGADWASTTLAWGVVGTTSTSATAVAGMPARTDFFSLTNPGGGAPTLPPANLVASLAQIANMYFSANAFGNPGSQWVTPLDSVDQQVDQVNGAQLLGITTMASATGSFSTQQSSGVPFNIRGLSASEFLTAVNSGNSAELAVLVSNAGPSMSVSGNEFALSSTGVLTYSFIPEPSTYAGVFAAIVSGVAVFCRRRILAHASGNAGLGGLCQRRLAL